MLDAVPERLAGHLLAAVTGKQHIQRLAVDHPRAAVFQIIFDPVHRLFTQRHQPFLVAFAYHPHHALAQTDVADGQSDQFGDPQPGGVQHFQHRLITQFQELIDTGGLQQRIDLRFAEIFRQPLRQLR
ncbi:hypothetical protein D3C72_896510 [compost metagenome]